MDREPVAGRPADDTAAVSVQHAARHLGDAAEVDVPSIELRHLFAVDPQNHRVGVGAELRILAARVLGISRRTLFYELSDMSRDD